MARTGNVTGNTDMLVMGLISNRDMYGYEIITELEKNSDHTFEMKAGTLYPLLHDLEMKGLIVSYERCSESGKMRKYYHITDEGTSCLQAKVRQWNEYCNYVNKFLPGIVN